MTSKADDPEYNVEGDGEENKKLQKKKNKKEKEKKKSKVKRSEKDDEQGLVNVHTDQHDDDEDDRTERKKAPTLPKGSQKDDNDEGDDNNNDEVTASSGNHHFYSKEKFASLPLSEKMLSALSELHYNTMTHIQHMAIPAILLGQDVIGAAPTGSGKTLAFVVPAIDLLYKTKFSNRQGTGTIIITPTRELALQIYGVVADICSTGNFNGQTYGLIMGGANRRTEADKLSKGICILVATPGRLLDHLQNTKGFITRNLLSLIIDEADRILEQGFEDDLRSILKLLPKSTSTTAATNNTNDTTTSATATVPGRQTILFSATQTKRVQDLVRLSMNIEKSVFVDIPVHLQNNNISNGDSTSKQATAVGIEQGFITCPSDQRFLLLFTFLKKNKTNKKIMVFFSSCNSVKYHSELLNYIDIPVMDIHGRQKQVKRTTTFFQFCKNTSGILLCTDVAARGLDIPKVDWIIQYDPPDDPKEYIHRVGRTARGASGSGRALLFLQPQEIGFLKYLRAANVVLNEYEFPASKVANIQSQYQRLIESNYYLNRAAKDAYRSYLLSYASHGHRNIFNVHELDLQGVCIAFGFTSPPRVDINLSIKDKKSSSAKSGSNDGDNTAIIGKRKKGIFPSSSTDNKEERKKQRIAASHSGHAFSADNPYGKRSANDKRQFTH